MGDSIGKQFGFDEERSYSDDSIFIIFNDDDEVRIISLS